MLQPVLKRKAWYTEHPILEKPKEVPFRKGYPWSRQRLRFVDQHNGDVVSDLVKQLALVTDQPVSRFVQINVPLALGACQDVKQFFTDRHGHSPSIRDFV
jgi:hypothetical protein